MKIFDYSNREVWLKGRMNGIGGSDAAAIIGQNPYNRKLVPNYGG